MKKRWIIGLVDRLHKLNLESRMVEQDWQIDLNSPLPKIKLDSPPVDSCTFLKALLFVEGFINARGIEMFRDLTRQDKAALDALQALIFQEMQWIVFNLPAYKTARWPEEY